MMSPPDGVVLLVGKLLLSRVSLRFWPRKGGGDGGAKGWPVGLSQASMETLGRFFLRLQEGSRTNEEGMFR